MKYALFLGCTIPWRLPFFELAVRKTIPEFGVEFVDGLSFGCCPDPTGIHSFNQDTWLALAARNLAIAEEEGLPILALCNGCFETLAVARHELISEKERKERVNEQLKEIDKEFKGTSEVIHLHQLLYNEIGIPKIKEKLTNGSFEGLKAGVHYGCHMLRPADILKVDDPERPTQLDELVEALGITSIPYLHKGACCGAGSKTTDPRIALEASAEKLGALKESGANMMVLYCPTCYLQYEVGQLVMRKDLGKTFNLPVMYYPELLGIGMGVDPKDLGINQHRIKPKFLQKSET
ncbi:MAG: CoB--CoM heterodisulfide reductase iron-sulfur subunit B family protein [Candidatus Hodarchaeales archaeon]|jgi:heterodisulfide reductase subunit B